MRVSYLQVGRSSRYFSLCGHLHDQVFVFHVGFELSSYAIGPDDGLHIHAATASVYRISFAGILHYFMFVFITPLSISRCQPCNSAIRPKGSLQFHPDPEGFPLASFRHILHLYFGIHPPLHGASPSFMLVVSHESLIA
jgi:hypothetical protein